MCQKPVLKSYEGVWGQCQWKRQLTHLLQKQGFTGCPDIHWIHMTANNSITNYIVLFHNVLDKIRTYFSRHFLFEEKNHSKLFKQYFQRSLTLTISTISQIYRRVNIFQSTESVNNLNKKAENLDLAGSWLPDVMTMWMQWNILLEKVRKSLSKDVPKNLVFNVHCRIKSINFCSCHQVWPFKGDMIAF